LNKRVFVAEVDTFAVGIVLHARRFGLFVAKSGAQVEPDYIIVSKAILITRWKFAVDAVADLVSGAEHGDGFLYDEGSVIEKVDVAVKVADALGLCVRRDAQQREQRKDTENAKIGAHGCGCHFGLLPC